VSWRVRGSQDETPFLYAGSNFPESEASEADFQLTNEGSLVGRHALGQFGEGKVENGTKRICQDTQ